MAEREGGREEEREMGGVGKRGWFKKEKNYQDEEVLYMELKRLSEVFLIRVLYSKEDNV